MSLTYAILPQSSLSIVRTGEIVTWAEIRCLMEALYRDPRRRPWYRTLWDLSALRCLVLRPQDLHTSVHATHELSPIHSDGDLAVVVSKRLDLDVQVLFLLQRTAWFPEVEVFPSVDEALRSLGHYGPVALP